MTTTQSGQSSATPAQDIGQPHTEVVPPAWRVAFLAACEQLPDQAPPIPYHQTPEGQRLAAFRKVCPEEFCAKVDRAKLPDPGAFDRVAGWDGTFPGPCAVGPTDTAKTRAAWSALGRLYVREARPFAWFPVRRLVVELAKYEDKGCPDEFYRHYGHYRALMVDDLDKINWQFESEVAALFAYYDWTYRARIACITTTNKDRAWWANKMGDAFARRLFDDAHYSVEFEGGGR